MDEAAIKNIPAPVKILAVGVIIAVIVYIYKKAQANNSGALSNTAAQAAAANAAQIAAEQQAANSVGTMNASGTIGANGSNGVNMSALDSQIANSFGSLGQQISSTLQPLTAIPGQVTSALSANSTAGGTQINALAQSISGLGTAINSDLTGAVTQLEQSMTAQQTAMGTLFTSRDAGTYWILGNTSLADCIEGGNVSQWCANTIGANEAARAGVNFNDPNAIKNYVQTTYGSCQSGQGYDPICVGKKIAAQINFGQGGG